MTALNLSRSFAKYLGMRGVHAYGEKGCQFIRWDQVCGVLSNANFPEVLIDLLIETIANYDPDSEFVALNWGSTQVTIEVFKAETL